MVTKSIKNRKGFTLVEVIVVAVIVAVLAAVAIPLYLNYVKDSRNNAAANVSGSVASFCGACVNSAATIAGIEAGTVLEGPATITCSNGTSVAVPAEMSVTASALSSPGTISAVHTADGSIAKVTTF